MSKAFSSRLAEIGQMITDQLAEAQARQFQAMMSIKDACERGVWCVECKSPMEFLAFSDNAETMPAFFYTLRCGCPIRLPALPMMVNPT